MDQLSHLKWGFVNSVFYVSERSFTGSKYRVLEAQGQNGWEPLGALHVTPLTLNFTVTVLEALSFPN